MSNAIAFDGWLRELNNLRSEPLEARGFAPPPDLQPQQGECLSLHPTQGHTRWNEGALRIG